MKIKPYNKVWHITVIIPIIVVIVLTPLCKNAQVNALTVVRVFNIGQCLYLFLYKFSLSRDPGYNFNFWEELPLYICNIASLSAVVASFCGFPSFLCCFVSTLGIVGALCALLFPEKAFCDCPLLSARCIGFYGYHGLLIASGILLVTTGFYRPEYRDILPAGLFVVVILAIVHCINILLRKEKHPQANYSFTFGARGNAILQAIYDRVPINLIYMYCLLPVWAVIAVILIFIYRI